MLFRSLRLAGRSLAQTRGALLAAVLTLALGISATTALFTLIHAVLLKPLPLDEPDRLMGLSAQDRQGRDTGLSWQDMRDLTTRTRSFATAAAYLTRTWGLTDDSGTPLEVVLSAMVTRDFFRTLGVVPVLGEPFAADAERTGSNHVLWLSHQLWQNRYGGNPSVVGRTVSLNDEPYRVAGVLPAAFRLPLDGALPGVYIPLSHADYCCKRDSRNLSVVARLSPGVSVRAANAELALVSRQWAQAWPDTNQGVQFHAVDLQSYLVGSRRQPLLLLFGCTGALLLLAALNAGAILLARALRRVREYAVKTSLGASAGDLIAEQLAQGLIVGAVTAAAGLSGAWLLLKLASADPLVGEALSAYARYGSLQIDLSVATFGILLSFVVSIAAALAPGLLLRPASLERTLRAGQPTRSLAVARLRAGMVVTQVGLSVLLLTAGALLMRGLQQVLSGDRGYRTEQVVIAAIGIPEARYDTDARMITFHQQVIERLQAIPGVSLAGGGVGLPAGRMRTRFFLTAEAPPPEQERSRATVAVASPEGLAVLGIPILRGRNFRVDDGLAQPLVALVNQSFIKRHLPGREPLGTRLRIGFYNGQMKPWSEVEIVGVVPDTRNRGLLAAAEPALYLSSRQVPAEGFFYLVRTSRSAATLQHEFQQAVWSIDRNLQAVRPRSLASHVEAELDTQRLALMLISGMAGVALILATVGLSASIAAGVAERTKEFGIRSALGATRARLQGIVLAGALRVVVLGLLLGLLASLSGISWLKSLLPQVTLGDPVLLGALGILLLLTGLIAGIWPAWRAGRIDPIEILRREG